MVVYTCNSSLGEAETGGSLARLFTIIGDFQANEKRTCLKGVKQVPQGETCLKLSSACESTLTPHPHPHPPPYTEHPLPHEHALKSSER